MLFESTINFEPVSLKRHRHRLKGGTYDPSKKDKDDFIKTIENFPTEKMTKPIKCILNFYCKRPKTHYKTMVTENTTAVATISRKEGYTNFSQKYSRCSN